MCVTRYEFTIPVDDDVRAPSLAMPLALRSLPKGGTGWSHAVPFQAR